ncbi:structural cement protein Gp24 [Fluviispira vulneris]|uniref:structural cement protein Gp24 n=1 Tax=Fluviispira vulneris TaxID=2763012 RepID=UPI00164537B8|nr:hypothetical protein [Fluviispira vulneris]
MADYSIYMDEGSAGQVYDLHQSIIRSFMTKSDLNIQYGTAVTKVQGTECQVKPLQNPTEEILGIVVNSVVDINNGIAGIPSGKSISVLNFGSIYVNVETDVLSGQSVYVRYSTAANAGSFRKDNDGGKAIRLPNAKFIKNASAGGLSVIEITGNSESPIATSSIDFDSTEGNHALTASFNNILLQNIYFISPVDVASNTSNNVVININNGTSKISTLSTAVTAIKAGAINKLSFNPVLVPSGTPLIANVAVAGTGALKGQFFIEYKVI